MYSQKGCTFNNGYYTTSQRKGEMSRGERISPPLNTHSIYCDVDVFLVQINPDYLQTLLQSRVA